MEAFVNSDTTSWQVNISSGSIDVLLSFFYQYFKFSI